MLNTTGAACVEADPELFYSYHPFDIQTAKEICNGDAKTPRCPIRDNCREWGLTQREWGVWGGLSEKDRERLTGKLPLVEAIIIPLRSPSRQASRKRRATTENLADLA